jgi:hypothetical protein
LKELNSPSYFAPVKQGLKSNIKRMPIGNACSLLNQKFQRGNKTDWIQRLRDGILLIEKGDWKRTYDCYNSKTATKCTVN